MIRLPRLVRRFLGLFSRSPAEPPRQQAGADARLRRIARICIVVCGVLGFAAYAQQTPLAQFDQITDQAVALLDALYKTIKLFMFSGPEAMAGHEHNLANWLLAVLRFLAPLCLAGYVISWFDKLWQPIVARLRLWGAKGHYVITGSDSQCWILIRNILAQGGTVVFIANSNEEAQMAWRRFGLQVIIVQGQVAAVEVWKRARIDRAALGVLLRTDGENLGLMKLLRGFKGRDGESGTTRISLRLSRLAVLRELVARPGVFAPGSRFRFEPFNPDAMAARAFFHNRTQFMDAAAAKAPGVHWLIFGASSRIEAMIEQLARIAPHPALETPCVTLFSTEPTRDHHLLDQKLGGLGTAFHYSVRPWEQAPAMPGVDDLGQIDEARPVTAILIANDGEGAPELALSLDGAAERGRIFSAPIFVVCAKGETLLPITDLGGGRITLAEPDEAVLTLENLTGVLDRSAQGLHQAYCDYAQGDHPDWSELDETYREANRRAADHAKTKLEALGVPGPLGSIEQGIEDLVAQHREELAIAEHESWRVDRLVNGWVFGETRDNQKRLHPNIKPYEELSTAEKNLDRWQVDQLPRIAKRRA